RADRTRRAVPHRLALRAPDAVGALACGATRRGRRRGDLVRDPAQREPGDPGPHAVGEARRGVRGRPRAGGAAAAREHRVPQAHPDREDALSFPPFMIAALSDVDAAEPTDWIVGSWFMTRYGRVDLQTVLPIGAAVEQV